MRHATGRAHRGPHAYAARVFRRRHHHRLVFVTGGSGFVGQHLQETLDARRVEWVAPSADTLDLHHRERVLEQVAEWRPDVIVHLAYRKSDAASIVGASANVAEAATAVRARLVHLSSDLVFAGRDAAYTEADVPDATLDYGRWKSEAEREVTARCPGAVLVRTSLLYGTEHLAPWQVAVRDRRPVTWSEGEVRSATFVDDLAAATSVLIDHPDVCGPLHVAGPEPLTRADLARATAAWLRADPASLRTAPGAAADRPGRVVLDSAMAAATLGIHCRAVSAVLR